MQSEAVAQALEDNPDALYEAFDAVTRVLLRDVMPPLMDAGWALFWHLAVILVVWTGIKQAFAGDGFQPWEFVRLVVALLIPLTMLQAYTAPLQLTTTIPITLPGTAGPLTFPELVTAQGTWIANAVNGPGGGMTAFWDYTHSLAVNMVGDAMWGFASAPEFEWWHLSRWAAWAFTSGLVASMVWSTFLLALIAVVIGFVQVIFAQVAITVCTVFGPLLIPWLLFEPMAFLFWGWLRSMLMYGLYSAVAAVVFRVILAIQAGVGQRVLDEVTPAQLLAGTSAEMQAAMMAGLHWYLIMAIASTASIMMCIKIPSLASGLVSGNASDSGVGTALGTAGAAVWGGAKMAGSAAMGRFRK